MTISFIIISVLGTMGFLGWQLGDIESICLMILAGFAIDYVVHLAHAFMESESPGRVERVADALADLGISVRTPCTVYPPPQCIVTLPHVLLPLHHTQSVCPR